MQTIGIIPARGGSKGLPGKNIKLLNGYPLIAYSIAISKLVKDISRVVVSTDSLEIADIAKKYGAEVPFLRPAELAKDESPDIDFILHAVNWFKENENKIPDYIVHLRPTTPLRDPVIISRAIKKIKDNSFATSLRSAHPAAESPFKWFLRNEQGFFEGLSIERSNDDMNLPRQLFPIAYIPDGYVDILKTVFIINSQSLYGDKMLGFISPACTEVDSLEEFEFLEFELKKNKNPAFEYLKANFPKKD
jgi:CMP-N,N'-diacetyllegionaminic acid synthase